MTIALRSGDAVSGARPALLDPAARVGTGRECGTCTLCCKVAAVEELSKPNGVWCRHCATGKRCTVYQDRPESCRSFYCQWMIESGLGPEWKPERAKFALMKSNGGRRVTALVDPGFPSAWRRAPYYQNLKHWAAQAVSRWPEPYLVDVLIGSRSIVILPDRDVEIGTLGPDEAIRLESRDTPAGRVIEASKTRRMSPTASSVSAGAGPPLI